MPGCCPHCGTAIRGLEAAGPGLHSVAPCGHFVDDYPLGELLAGAAVPQIMRERRSAVQAAGNDLLIPDGGRSTGGTKRAGSVSRTGATDVLALVGYIRRALTGGDRRLTLGTVDIDAVTVRSNEPVTVDETFVTAFKAVEHRLSRWRTLLRFVGESHP